MSHLRFQYLTVLITQHHVAEIVKIKTQWTNLVILHNEKLCNISLFTQDNVKYTLQQMEKGRWLLHLGTNTVVKGPDETVFTCEF